jgi:serine/threonine protein kinase
MIFSNKYSKYKNKYINLKNQIAGSEEQKLIDKLEIQVKKYNTMELEPIKFKLPSNIRISKDQQSILNEAKNIQIELKAFDNINKSLKIMNIIFPNLLTSMSTVYDLVSNIPIYINIDSDKYYITKLLHRGSNRFVFLYSNGKKHIVLKIMNKYIECAIAEKYKNIKGIIKYKQIKHPDEQNDTCYILMDYYQIDLHELRNICADYDNETELNIYRIQMIKIIEHLIIMIYYLYVNNIIYTDIKLQNILINCIKRTKNSITLKLLLCDIGSIFDSQYSHTYYRKKNETYTLNQLITMGKKNRITRENMIISIIHILTELIFILDTEFYETKIMKDDTVHKQNLGKNMYVHKYSYETYDIANYEKNIISWFKEDNKIIYDFMKNLYTNIPTSFNELFEKINKLRMKLERQNIPKVEEQVLAPVHESKEPVPEQVPESELELEEPVPVKEQMPELEEPVV